MRGEAARVACEALEMNREQTLPATHLQHFTRRRASAKFNLWNLCNLWIRLVCVIPSRDLQPSIKDRAVAKTDLSISGVSRPVFVFWRLG